jgi:hypothetical protein
MGTRRHSKNRRKKEEGEDEATARLDTQRLLLLCFFSPFPFVHRIDQSPTSHAPSGKPHRAPPPLWSLCRSINLCPSPSPSFPLSPPSHLARACLALHAAQHKLGRVQVLGHRRLSCSRICLFVCVFGLSWGLGCVVVWLSEPCVVRFGVV